jgi:adenine-specific DNA methylase
MGPDPRHLVVRRGIVDLRQRQCHFDQAAAVTRVASWEKLPTEEAQERERERLFGIIRKMMAEQLYHYAEVYTEARAEMLKYCDGRLPPLLDPFAGGGSMPLEAARLGMEACAGDINLEGTGL